MSHELSCKLLFSMWAKVTPEKFTGDADFCLGMVMKSNVLHCWLKDPVISSALKFILKVFFFPAAHEHHSESCQSFIIKEHRVQRQILASSSTVPGWKRKQVPILGEAFQVALGEYEV